MLRTIHIRIQNRMCWVSRTHRDLSLMLCPPRVQWAQRFDSHYKNQKTNSMKFKYFGSIVFALTEIFVLGSCKKYLDVNRDPNNLPASSAPIAQELTAAQMNLAFEGGSDLFRYAAEIMQQMSGEASSPNQTWSYYRYIISGTDVNNAWGAVFAASNGT